MTAIPTPTEVYRAHAIELTRYATVLVGPDDAADVVTDAMLRAFASRRWDEIDNHRAYLYRAVANQATTFHRATSRRRRREQTFGQRAAKSFVDPESSIDAFEALNTLSTRQRAVVYLAYWDDRPADEIADLLDISVGSVKQHLARGRDQLRKVLSS